MISLTASYSQLTTNFDKSLTRVASEPSVKREADYYKANIGKVKTIDDFMKDNRLFSFAMTAFGLKDMIYAKGFIKKALTEGVDSAQAFSVKLSDPRFREFVTTFNFKRNGTTTTSSTDAQQGTVNRYVEQALEEQAGAQDQGLQLALYFQRKAPSLKDAYSILADKAVYTVVQTALGLPQALSGSDIDKQAKIIGNKVKVADFSDPTKLKTFINRFLAQYQAQNSATEFNPAVSLFSSSSPTVDLNTLLSIQSLKRFGS